MGSSRREAIVLGATGQVGPFLAQRLAEAGWRGTVHSRSRPAQTPLPWAFLDVTAPGDWQPAPGAVVFSTLPLWLLPPVLPRLAGARQIIAFGSTSQSVKRTSTDPAERALAARLSRAEQDLAQGCARHKMPWTLLRPTLVYGSGADRNISAIARFIRRVGIFPIARPGSGLRQPVHADDLAQVALAAAGNAQAYERVFALSGGETLTYRAMVERVFRGMGRRPRVVPIPAALLAQLLRLGRWTGLTDYSPRLAARMNEDLVFDHSDAAQILGYRPRPFHPTGAELGLEDPRRRALPENETP